ncbi:MAG: hypothetical protein WA056_10495 [Gallionella sp.]
MNDLGEKIKDLAIKYLLAEMRDYRGAINRDKQAEKLVQLIKAERIENLFYFGEKEISGPEREYQYQLDKLCSNRNQQDIERANREKQEIYEQIVHDVLDKTNDEGKTQGLANDAWRLNRQIEDLRAEIEFGKPANSVTFWDRLNSRVNLPYLVIFCLVIVLIGGLVLIGMTATMTVNVEFNVGEIIGGLLVGTGVAAAGVSYATKNNGKNANEEG